MLDCSQMTYAEMADIVRAIREEVQTRSPGYALHVFRNKCNDIVTVLDVLDENKAHDISTS